MTVERVESLDGKKCRVCFAEGGILPLSAQEAERLGLSAGRSISRAQFDGLWQLTERRAREKALLLLKMRDRTRSEMRQKLCQAPFPDGIVEETMAFLEEYGYLNDERYAAEYVELYRARKSRAELLQALLRRGVGRETVEKALGGCGEAGAGAAIAAVLRRRGYGKEGGERADQKTVAYLLRRGFSWEEIRRETARFQAREDGVRTL